MQGLLQYSNLPTARASYYETWGDIVAHVSVATQDETVYHSKRGGHTEGLKGKVYGGAHNLAMVSKISRKLEFSAQVGNGVQFVDTLQLTWDAVCLERTGWVGPPIGLVQKDHQSYCHVTMISLLIAFPKLYPVLHKR